MGEVKESEYKGNPMIVLASGPDDKFPFQFGVRKAKLILEHIEDIKKAVNFVVSRKDKKMHKVNTQFVAIILSTVTGSSSLWALNVETEIIERAGSSVLAIEQSKEGSIEEQKQAADRLVEQLVGQQSSVLIGSVGVPNTNADPTEKQEASSGDKQILVLEKTSENKPNSSESFCQGYEEAWNNILPNPQNGLAFLFDVFVGLPVLTALFVVTSPITASCGSLFRRAY